MAQFAMVAMMAVNTGLQVWSQYKSGQEEAYNIELEGKQDEVMVLQREADRKWELAKILASQNAEAGAKNIRAFEGSPLSIMMESAQRENEFTERERYEYKLRQRGRRRSIRGAKDKSYVAMASSLLQGGLDMTGVMGGGKKAGMGTSATGGGFTMQGTKYSGSKAPKGNLGKYYEVSLRK